MNKIFLVSILIIIQAFLAAGCASKDRDFYVPKPKLLIGNYGSYTVSFYSLVVDIPIQTKVGHHHDGFLKVPQYPLNWGSDTYIASDAYKEIANKQLHSRGYTTPNISKNMFEEDNSIKSQFQIGATLITLMYDTYAPLAGDSSDAMIVIEWRLYNTHKEEVVYTVNTTGKGKQNHIGSDCIERAFVDAFEDLLDDPSFHNILSRQQPIENPQYTQLDQPITISLNNSKPPILLPDNMQSAIDGTVIIKSGLTHGSGVLISPDGWIYTAAHVVSGVSEVLVEKYSGETFTGKVIRIDAKQDVAIIQIPGNNHHYLEIENNNIYNIGSDVFAIGAPKSKELSFSVSKGVISGIRKMNDNNYIQTDAALNPGNSGGPLLNTNGKVIGIVSWKYSDDSIEGISFGIPIDTLPKKLNIAFD